LVPAVIDRSWDFRTPLPGSYLCRCESTHQEGEIRLDKPMKKEPSANGSGDLANIQIKYSKIASNNQMEG
jgi:hypothetical protein